MRKKILTAEQLKERARKQVWYLKNRERVIERQREYRKTHADKSDEYYEKNREAVLKRKRDKYRQMKKNHDNKA